jgi:predicted O-methyltransferase YrrM
MQQTSPIHDLKVNKVLAHLHAAADRQTLGIGLRFLPQLPSLLLGRGIHWEEAPNGFCRDKYLALNPAQGQMLYLLARAMNARTVVEFGTSFGVSTIYLACAVRDNGGGVVVGTEMVVAKAAQARRNLTEAGLADFVEIREGDALATLRDFGRPIDLLLNDGFPAYQLDVLRLLDPFIRPGSVVFTDNLGLFKKQMQPYLDFLREPANGYQSATLKLNEGTELSVKRAAH